MTTSSGANNQKTLLGVAAAVIIALLALNIFLWVNRSQTNKANEELTTQLDESEQLKTELEKEYYQALSELEEMRGSNEELNALIETQKQELKDQKGRIQLLLRDKKSLDKARSEINGMNAKVQEYLAEINQLKEENALLMGENAELTEVNDELNTNLTSAQEENRQLARARTTLLSEKQQLERTKSDLSKKVNIASVVKVNNVDVQGYKERDNGKLAKRGGAKNIDQLEVCFTTTINDIATTGSEMFIMRIINPQGETLAIESLGSGTFVNNATGDKMRYTQAAQVPYDQAVDDVCISWKPGQAFAEGAYTVEIYNKGYLAGKGNFDLR